MRATRPDDGVKVLRAGGDAVGPDNDVSIIKHCAAAGMIVAAWGAAPFAAARAAYVAGRLAGKGVRCLGMTKDGSPRHPLYVPAWQQPVAFFPRGKVSAP
jgi:hypothetical protein